LILFIELRIKAILSDFDGTLCPTSSCVNHHDDKSYNLIPSDLEELLCNISKSIPFCIVSSKDFYFLYEKIKKFSNIISCILGMETLFLDGTDKNIGIDDSALYLTDNKKIDNSQFSIIDNKYSIASRHLLIDNEILLNNSAILKEIVNYFEIKYPMIDIEKKFLTVNEGILGGITIDWRNDNDWNTNRKRYERIVKKSLFNVYKKPSNLQLSSSHFYYYLQKFFVQNYTTHPFIDIYSTKISKGEAYDCIISEL
jgi:hydroxymethylpyrimidine pyrophosphatase-like HAD family hydrolase